MTSPKQLAEQAMATALTQKTIFDGLAQLRAQRKRCNRGLWTAWSAASAARAIETDLLPAYEVFFAAIDRTNALVDQRIAEGTWESHPFIAEARRRIDTYRAARDKLSILVKRAVAGEATRRELLAELRSAPH